MARAKKIDIARIEIVRRSTIIRAFMTSRGEEVMHALHAAFLGFRVTLLSCAWCRNTDDRLPIVERMHLAVVEAWHRRHAPCEERARRESTPGWRDAPWEAN